MIIDIEVMVIYGKYYVILIDLKSKNSECENLLVDVVLIRFGIVFNVEFIKEKVIII